MNTMVASQDDFVTLLWFSHKPTQEKTICSISNMRLWIMGDATSVIKHSPSVSSRLKAFSLSLPVKHVTLLKTYFVLFEVHGGLLCLIQIADNKAA